MNKTLIDQTASDYINAPEDVIQYHGLAAANLRAWWHLKADGFDLTLTDDQPYVSSTEMFLHITRKRIRVFAGGTFADNNPLAKVSIFNDTNGQPVTYFQIARAVHDIEGHYPERAPFETFEGEVLAHLTYRKLFPAYCHPALFADDIGQLCHYFSTGEFVENQRPVYLTPRPLGEYLVEK